jgi:hypothetical protein
MLEALVTGKRGVAAVVCVTAIVIGWRMWPAPVAATPRKQVVYTVVPLAGEPLREAEARGQCLPFLAPLVAHDDWQLQIARGTSGCLGDFLDASFTVHADGRVEWQQPDMPVRHLSLTTDELHAIRELDRASCVVAERRGGYYVDWYRVGVGSDPNVAGGADVPMESELARRLDAIFDAAQSRYRQRVLGLGTLIGRLTARVDGRTYHVEIADHLITVARHGRVWASRELDDSELVDLIDALWRQPHELVDEDSLRARGAFWFAGHTYQVSISWAERRPLSVIDRVITDAAYYER